MKNSITSHFNFLDTLRGLAAWLVVYDHLACVYPEAHGFELTLVRNVNELINQPLGLIQNFGWFGVCLFFLISGFVITHVSLRERPVEFVIKRIFRIFPLITLAVVLVLLLDEGVRSQVTLWGVLSNMLLVNYWQHPQVVLVGVAWTLAIEILFYAAVLLTYPLQPWPALRSGFLLLSVAGVVMMARDFGDSFFLFSASVAYLPYLATGQILYYLIYQRSYGVATGLVLTVAAYVVTLIGLRSIHVQFLPAGNSYLTSYMVALVVFLLAWQLNDRLNPSLLIRQLSETSYSVYLFHGIIGFFLLDLLVPHLGFGASLFLTICSIILLVLAIHYILEKPMLKLGRRLSIFVLNRPHS